MIDDLEIRSATVDDIDFIADSWLRAARDSNWGRGIPNSSYYHWYHKVIEALLARCYVRVASIPFGKFLGDVQPVDGRPDYIVGYIVFEPMEMFGTVVHMTVVRDEKSIQLTRQGIGNKLIDHAIGLAGYDQVVYTTNTPIFANYGFRSKMRERGYLFNPYLLIKTLSKDFDKDQYGRKSA